ncbi:HD domain-containing protein [Enterovirga rhinocerotis]|uniref:HD domain-containing protein n=1 Tax=Enterovirga rhinocerotis TaxID=1339210 RepID=A0A4R7C7D8_9HYPH|nr:HD domain-containing protein [Enterovirga rhinocerotis]TDR94550.1 hypothetical protein EV668_1838 [Enterovirga rhinocerotis]
MAFFTIERGSPDKRRAVEAALHGLDLVSSETRERIVTAWVSAWSSSSHATLEEMPYSPDVDGFSLLSHVNEVVRTGLVLAGRAEQEWGRRVDPETFVPILVLHDIDKPLLFERRDGIVVFTPLSKQMAHGVVGAMLLRDLGFDDLVVATVSTHAMNAPFHGSTHEAYLLHYADLFSSDRAFADAGLTPFYQRHWA